MDASQVDRFIASLPRRSIIGTFIALGLTESAAEAKDKKKKRKKKKRKKAENDLCSGLIDRASCDRFIGGNALSLLGAGSPGVLSIVKLGGYDGNTLPFIIRNNTGADVRDVSATATARNAAGQLIASGEDQGIEPNILRAGSVAMGYIYFGGVTLGPDARVSIQFASKKPSDFDLENERDLVFVDANFTGEVVVSTMANGYNKTLRGPIGAEITCFDETGSIIEQTYDFTNSDFLPPGAQAFFQFPSYVIDECPFYLVTGSAFTD